MSTSSAFWALFFAVQLPIVQAKNTVFGLTKLAAAACMQCTAQRQQKAANTSLLESRNLLQTSTLVFPRSIVCSRLSNNINILAKNFSGRQRGGGAWPPGPPGSATGLMMDSFCRRRCCCGCRLQLMKNKWWRLLIDSVTLYRIARFPISTRHRSLHYTCVPIQLYYLHILQYSFFPRSPLIFLFRTACLRVKYLWSDGKLISAAWILLVMCLHQTISFAFRTVAMA